MLKHIFSLKAFLFDEFGCFRPHLFACVFKNHICSVVRYNSIIGSEKTRSVHRVFLLQHPEASDQPPAEVFPVSLLVINVTEVFHIQNISPRVLQRLRGSAVSP